MLLVGAAAVVLVPDAAAITREELAARRAEREAERDARQAARDAERAARDAEREAEEEAEAANCGCSATVGFSAPDLQWRSNNLVFVPRVDVSIRTRGEASQPNWSAGLTYQGTASFLSEDVAAPGVTSFAGSRTVASGPCGDNRYTFKGLALEPVTLAGVARSLVGVDQELDGMLRMMARIEGCGFDEETKAFPFIVQEFGNLSVRGWRTAR